MRFVPIVYEHAAALIGCRPYEVSRDASLLVEAHTEAYMRYHHSPVIVGIDVYNVEAEAYGSRVQDAGGTTIPSIKSPLCDSIRDLRSLPPINPRKDGRLPLILESARILREQCKGAIVAVPLSGPFSIAQGLLGLESLLMATMEDPDLVREGLSAIALHLGPIIEEIHATGCEAILFESSASPPLLSPALFRKSEAEALEHIGTVHKRLTGRKMAMILGGNTLPIVDDLIRAGAGSVICPAEIDGAAFLDRMSAYPDVAVRLNMRPGVFAATFDEAAAEASKALDVARGRRNVCIGSGVLPYDALPDIVLKIQHRIEEPTQ